MKRHLSLYGALALVACAALFTACASPGEGKPDAVVSEPAPAEPAPAPAGMVLPIDASSTLGFVGAKVTGSHEGGFKSFSGEVNLVDNDPAKSSVKLEIQMNSVFTDAEKLTGHLMSADFFDVEKFPTATFASTAIVKTETGYDVTADLTLHGVTKGITFPAQVTVADGKVTASAEFNINRQDFGISYPGMKDNAIKDEVLIRFNIVAGGTQAASAEAGPSAEAAAPEAAPAH